MNKRRLKGEPPVVTTTIPAHFINFTLERSLISTGKQLVYHALQDISKADTPDAIATLDDEIRPIQNDLSALKVREKELREELADVSAIIPIAELCESVSKLEEEKASSLDRLSKIQEEGTVCVSVEELTQVDNEWKKWQNHVQTRRRIFYELWARCTEVLPDDTTEEDLKVGSLRASLCYFSFP
jgi:26S proteasome regulatory subunit (ATPase 3-interacting protein)